MTEAARPGVYTPAGRGMDPEEIWALGRPELDAIQHEAARRIVSPWAMLGMALGQSLCAIPYTVRYRSDLMPEGTPLNLATVIVGGPGAGKSTADLAAQTLFAFGGEAAPDMEQVRSGEGIVGVFAYLEEHEDDDGRKRRRTRYRRATHAHRILWDEVRAFGAQASRTGSTLVDTVNTAVTGGTLGGQASKGTASHSREATTVPCSRSMRSLRAPGRSWTVLRSTVASPHACNGSPQHRRRAQTCRGHPHPRHGSTCPRINGKASTISMRSER